MKSYLLCVLGFIALLLPSCSLLAAQESKVSVSVTIEVTDGHGSVIPNSQTEITSLASANSQTLVTDKAGLVQLQLEPGSYDLVVTSLAFKTLNRRITVNAGEGQKFEIALQVGGCPIPDPCSVVADGTAQAAVANTMGRVEEVNFCDLMGHPDLYSGKTVQVTAVYAVGFHEAIFFDDACKESPSGPHPLARAKFSGDEHETAAAFETLRKALRRYKASEARVTIVALFGDTNVLAGCCRYALDVKRVLAVEKVKPPAETNSKN